MKQSPYSELPGRDLILRDELAIDRTLLANERTLLSYLRSGVSLLIAGASIMHFASQEWFFYFGAACIPLGLGTTVLGTVRFLRQREAIEVVRRDQEKA